MGLRDVDATCPSANYISAKPPHDALKSTTRLKLETAWESLRAQLPELVQVLIPERLKHGDIWLGLQARRGMAWVVLDTIVNFKTIPQGLSAWPYWIRGLRPELRIPFFHKMLALKN